MCVKLPKTLNPQAEEWRPISATPPPPRPPLLPHATIHPAPQPPQLVVELSAATHHLLPVYTISNPSVQYLQKEMDAPEPLTFEEKTQNFEPHEENKNKLSQQRAPKKFLPPRLRRALSPHTPPPPPSKQEWRPKHAPAITSKAPGDDGGAAASPSRTTLMIKNIPNQLRRDFMLKFLDGYCKTHSLAYDFLYLPFDFRRLGNFGYAFVNFTTAAAAVKMKKILTNYKWRTTYTDDGEFVYSKKVCEMTWARIQGKEALVRRFQKVRFNCDDEEFLPVVLDPARNGSDPNPPAPVNLGSLSGPAH